MSAIGSSKIIILNGGSSAGKTSLAKALQQIMVPTYMLLGIDAFWLALPPQQLDLETVSPECFRWQYEHIGGKEYFRVIPGPLLDVAMKARFWAVRQYLERGLNVVADEVFWSFDWVLESAKAFAGFDVYLVGVYCDDDELDRREAVRGDRWSGWGRGSQHFAHQNMKYDLIVDTTHSSSVESANVIKAAINDGLQPSALKALIAAARVGVAAEPAS